MTTEESVCSESEGIPYITQHYDGEQLQTFSIWSETFLQKALSTSTGFLSIPCGICPQLSSRYCKSCKLSQEYHLTAWRSLMFSLTLSLFTSISLVLLSSDRTQPSSASSGTLLQQQHLAFVSKCQVTVCISRRNCPIHFCSSCLSKPGNIDHSLTVSIHYIFFSWWQNMILDQQIQQITLSGTKMSLIVLNGTHFSTT